MNIKFCNFDFARKVEKNSKQCTIFQRRSSNFNTSCEKKQDWLRPVSKIEKGGCLWLKLVGGYGHHVKKTKVLKQVFVKGFDLVGLISFGIFENGAM
jgi:hypothetical protein